MFQVGHEQNEQVRHDKKNCFVIFFAHFFHKYLINFWRPVPRNLEFSVAKLYEYKICWKKCSTRNLELKNIIFLLITLNFLKLKLFLNRDWHAAHFCFKHSNAFPLALILLSASSFVTANLAAISKWVRSVSLAWTVELWSNQLIGFYFGNK